MSENIVEIGNSTIIFNGGDPLPGCPESWEEANAWADKANKDKSSSEPRWSFDCGFKLNFDGPILSISSRFYPPKTDYGPKWDGTVTLYFLSKEYCKKKFEEDSLDDLKSKVEEYVKQVIKAMLLD